MAEQPGEDPGAFAEYGGQQQTAYEHVWEIWDHSGYRDFVAGEEETRGFLAARVWSHWRGRRTCSTGRRSG